jgi:hypothetical protein
VKRQRAFEKEIYIRNLWSGLKRDKEAHETYSIDTDKERVSLLRKI